MTTQKTDQSKQKLSEGETPKKLFVEPEILGPVDVLESTAFFGSSSGPNEVIVDFG